MKYPIYLLDVVADSLSKRICFNMLRFAILTISKREDIV